MEPTSILTPNLDLEAIKARLEAYELMAQEHEPNTVVYSPKRHGKTPQRRVFWELIAHAPADLRALLDTHDADQARIETLETKRRHFAEESLTTITEATNRIAVLETALRDVIHEGDKALREQYAISRGSVVIAWMTTTARRALADDAEAVHD